jgi:hypothetical protein
MHAILKQLRLMAQTPSPLSGEAGWLGTGLLGSVLAWLFIKYLPSKDAQLKEFIDSRDKLMHDLMEDYKRNVADLGDRVAVLDRERRNDVRELLNTITSKWDHESEMGQRSMKDLMLSINGLRSLIEKPHDEHSGHRVEQV